MMNWLQKMFYTWSGHDARQESWDHEMALRNMRQTGIEIGKKHVPAPVISQGTCPRHPLVLLVIKGHGDFSCISCKDEERNTGPIRAQHPMMNLYNAARKQGAGPQTAVQMITPKLTRNLKEWKQHGH